MKRICALLLCVCIVLGMLPNSVVFSANGNATDVLAVDQNGQGFCPACQTTVKWTAFSGSGDGTVRIGQIDDKAHHHIYLSADVDARKVWSHFINLLNSQLCLHLNGHDLTYGGYMYASNSTLNIMGSGKAIFTATKTSSGFDQAGLYVTNSALNIYGGSFSVADKAATDGKPTVYLNSGRVNVQSATVQGTTSVVGGMLTLKEAAQLDTIQVGSSGKLFVENTWSGNAQVSFDAGLQGNVVPSANGASNGAFSGTLRMDDGVVLVGSDAGTLTVSGANAGLVLDANSQALCPVCNKIATWTAFAGSSDGTNRIGQINDKTHHHIYLSADVDARKVWSHFINLLDSQLCLHLNGHNLTYGGYIYASNATLNIMGSGNTTFTATKTTSGFDQAGFYIAGGSTLNLYGGSYGVAEKAATEGKPTVYLNSGCVNVKSALVQGIASISGGTLTMEETAQLENIQVGSAGKLFVTKEWKGTAKVVFASQLQDNVVPAANGGADGRPIVLTESTGSSQVNLAGAEVKGPVLVETGNLTLQRKTSAENIWVSSVGKLTVCESFSGTAQVDFAVMLENNEVPAANAAAEGAFSGVLTMTDGSQLLPTEKGTLVREITLSVDENSQALCPVCNEIVTWTAFSGSSNGTERINQIDDKAHHHIYLTADVNAKKVWSYFINLLNKVTKIKDDLDALQKAVSIGADYQGLIEFVSIGNGDCIMCNEEGKLIGLEGNRRLGNDILVGVFYIMSENEDKSLAGFVDNRKRRLWEENPLGGADERRT